MRLRFGLKQLGEGFGLGLSLFVAAAFYALFVGRTAFSVQGVRYFTLVDDAMISMRYGRNLANGFGLVWNPGQPPVEGFTNMAWTLYMAVLHMLPISESKISLAVMLTSGVLLLVTAFVSFALCRAIAPNSKNAPLIASTITAFYFPLVFWSLRGMELALTTFLVYLVVLLWITAPKLITSRRAFLLSLLVLLAILVRFDTILQITIIIVSTLYETLFEQKAGKAGLVLLSPILMLYLAGIVGVLLFQLHYFGSIFPNTYYLKVEGVSLRERLLVGTQAFAEYAARDVLTLFFIAGLGPLILRDLRKTHSALLFALFLVQCVYSVYVGGDFAEPLGAPQVDAANRFITQGMPSLIILFSLVIDRVLQLLLTEVHGRASGMAHPSGTMVFAISIAALLVISGPPWFNWTIHNAPFLVSDIWRTKLGLQIEYYTDQDAVVAQHASGQIAYYSHRQSIDLLGMSDPVVAMGPPAASFRPGHNKWNYEYSILTLKPDLIADEWGQLAAFLSDKHEYYRLDNGIWVRKDSTHIDVEGLAQEYR